MGQTYNENQQKQKFIQRLLRGLESALPFLAVWFLIFFLMAGGAVLQHFGYQKPPVESSKPSVVSMGDRT